MDKQILKILFLLLTLSSKAQDSTKKEDLFSLSLPRSWHILVPIGFQREDLLGVDSEVGTFIL